MGLKCSLFGHAFDERDMVRERESKGSEVVTVVKDVERCTECDATRVVSTNKEVVSTAGATADGGVSSDTTLRTPGDAGEAADAFESPDQLGADAPNGPGAPTTGTDTPAATATETGDDTGGFDGLVDRSDASAEADDGAATPGGPEMAADADEDGGVELMTDDADAATDLGAGDPADVDLDPEAIDAEAADAADDDPVTEDAEILTDEPEPDRAPGQWPGDGGSEAWEPQPLTRDDEAAADEDAAETDADGADEGDGDQVDGDDADEAAAEILDASEDAGGTPDTAAEPAPDIEPEPAATASFTVPEGHYRCPECGHTIPAESSFRRGDACPECVHGYLEAGE